MPRHGQLNSDAEAQAGSKEALKGAIYGAAVVRLALSVSGNLREYINP